MQKLKDRYFIRYNTQKDHGVRLPLANARTLLRVFVHFISGDEFLSLEIYREDYFSKGVSKMQRKNGVLTAGNKQTLRQKVLGESASAYEQLTNQFQEGLYDPEKDGKYEVQEISISKFDKEQFENAIEILSIIQEEGSI